MGATVRKRGKFMAGSCLLLLAICITALCAGPAAGAIKRYKDEKGNLRITNEDQPEASKKPAGAPPPAKPQEPRSSIGGGPGVQPEPAAPSKPAFPPPPPPGVTPEPNPPQEETPPEPEPEDPPQEGVLPEEPPPGEDIPG
jgi:hypothetical protein